MNSHKYILTYFSKIVESIEHPKLWVIFTGIGAFISQYIFSEWVFAMGFIFIFILDTFSGTYVAKRTGKFTGKIFREKLSDKCVAYFTIIISFSIATKITLEQSDWNGIRYLNIPFYTLFIVVELRSILNTWYQFKQWYWLGELLNLLDRKSKSHDTDQK